MSDIEEEREEETISYIEYKSKFKTGDLLLFGGDSLFSAAVKMATLSSISHIGMVFRFEEPFLVQRENERYRAELIQAKDNLYFWHSQLTEFENTADIFSGEPKTGVQLNYLSSVIDEFDDNVVRWRPLVREVPTCDHHLIEWLKKQAKKPYEKNCGDLMYSVLSKWCYIEPPRHTDNSYFCSELMIRTYQRLKLIHSRSQEEVVVPSHYVPQDFMPGGEVDDLVTGLDNSLDDKVYKLDFSLPTTTAAKSGSWIWKALFSPKKS